MPAVSASIFHLRGCEVRLPIVTLHLSSAVPTSTQRSWPIGFPVPRSLGSAYLRPRFPGRGNGEGTRKGPQQGWDQVNASDLD